MYFSYIDSYHKTMKWILWKMSKTQVSKEKNIGFLYAICIFITYRYLHPHRVLYWSVVGLDWLASWGNSFTKYSNPDLGYPILNTVERLK